MKKIKIMVVSLLILLFSSCNDDSISEQAIVHNNEQSSLSNKAGVTALASDLTEYPLASKFAKTGVTILNFQVYDVGGLRPLAVKFFDRSTGETVYVSMARVGLYWKLSKTMQGNGWYDWRYVYNDTKSNISTTAYELCSTYNTFNSTGISSIRWPFGADGSTWNNKTCYINGTQQQWLRGNLGGGLEWDQQPSHIGNTEIYAVDWNRRKVANWSTSDDLGAELKSPLDGEVLNFGTYSTSCCGASKFVAVVQEAPDGKTYKFFFGHLQSYPTYFVKKTSSQRGTPVKAGWTTLGWLGSTGATSPHAHCSMRNNATDYSVKFEFDAQ